MTSKLIGGILLCVGTAVGGGMLALPMAVAELGFIHSLLFLFFCWAIMTLSAFLVLEVHLWFSPDNHLISMAKATLGPVGELVAWVCYLVLLYALLAAFMAGGGNLFNQLFTSLGWKPATSLATLLFTGLLGAVVCCGVCTLDYVNRSLMLAKAVAYCLLLLCILPFVSSQRLLGGHYCPTEFHSLTVMITSFGFAIIVPSLRRYFNEDIAALRKAIWIGSLIPLFCYILWNAAIIGSIPRQGAHGLIAMRESGHSTSDLISALSALLSSQSVRILARGFTAICLTTSFLGVALSLSDFLVDGLTFKNASLIRPTSYGVTFLPPLVVVLLYPDAFIYALHYAGLFCAFLLVLLPVMMAWSGRYVKGLAHGYQLLGGKGLLLILGIAASWIIVHH